MTSRFLTVSDLVARAQTRTFTCDAMPGRVFNCNSAHADLADGVSVSVSLVDVHGRSRRMRSHQAERFGIRPVGGDWRKSTRVEVAAALAASPMVSLSE